MIGLHFLGISYLLVYVGAISILFLFILMLINIRVSELITDNKNSVALAILAVLLYSYAINNTLTYNTYVLDLDGNYNLISIYNFFENVYSQNINANHVASISWDSLLIVTTHINSIGNILYTNLFIIFIITSLILLLAMIGAILITISKPNYSNYAFITNNVYSKLIF